MLRKTLQHRLFKNTSALMIMQLFTYVAPFIVLPYLSRVLGADGFGLMVAALSLTIVANVCTDFGFNLSATYLISRKQKYSQYISKVLTSIYLLKLAFLAAVFIGVSIYLALAVSYTATAIAAIYTTIFFQAFMSPWLFQGIEKMKLITYSTIVSRLMYIVMIFVLVKEKNDYDIALLCHAVATIFACILANALIFREGFTLRKPSMRLIRFLFRHSSQFFLSRVSLQASSSISVLVLNAFVPASQVGLYGASNKLFVAFKSLISPFSQALYPYMAKTGNSKLLFKLTLLIGLAMLVPAGLGFWFAEDVLNVIFGSEFIGSAHILRIFIVTGYFAFFSICLGYPAFASFKRVDLANKSVIVGGLAQIAILVALMLFDVVNIVTVALSVLASLVIILGMRVYWVAKLNLALNRH